MPPQSELVEHIRVPTADRHTYLRQMGNSFLYPCTCTHMHVHVCMNTCMYMHGVPIVMCLGRCFGCWVNGLSSSQRAILKFCSYTGATPVAGRFTPGTFTNQIQAAFREPRLLIVSDPRSDHQVLGTAVFSLAYLKCSGPL